MRWERRGSSLPQKSRAQGQEMATDASSHTSRGPGQGQTFGGVNERKASLPGKDKRVPMTPGVVRLWTSWRTGRLWHFWLPWAPFSAGLRFAVLAVQLQFISKSRL